ncbi:MAG: LamG domain-containing protein [Candidatus Bathyarchaeota archaeon]|nr:LamG domain-containing protein [Candidatus Bathyarchaeota archaeon]
MNPLPLGWGCTKSLTLFAGSGSGTNYQIIIKAYFGNGTDGTEILNEETIAKFYCNGKCQTDFGDIRFLPNNCINPYTYKLCSKVDGDWAVFAVKISEDLDVNQTIRAAYNNPAAVDVSSDDVFINKIDNVVGAWPLDEEDQEVDPVVIADDDQASFWSKSASLTLTNETIIKKTGTNSLKIVGSSVNVQDGLWHLYAGNQDLSGKSVLRFCFFGANTGNVWRLYLTNAITDNQFTGSSGYFLYGFVDDFVGEREFVLPISSMTVGNSPDLSTIRKVILRCEVPTTSSFVVYFDRFVVDDGVPAIDYSGNNNDGAATGTTISSTGGKWAGLRYRVLNGLSGRFDFGDILDQDLTSSFSFMVYFKTSTTGVTQTILRKGNTGYNPYYFLRIGVDNKLNFAIFDGSNNTEIAPFSTVTDGNWHSAICVYNVVDHKLYLHLDTVKSTSPDTSSVTSLVNDLPFRVGSDSEASASGCFNGSLSSILFFNTALSDAQVSVLNSGYPDPTLIEGSICVRKWATTTMPTFGEWSAEENIIFDTMSLADAALIFKTITSCDVINLEELTVRDKLLTITELLSTLDGTITPTRLIRALETAGLNDITHVQKIVIINDATTAQDAAAKVKNTKIFLLIGDLAIQISNAD